jgi:quercetin dioxygenase-like cupin family protein
MHHVGRLADTAAATGVYEGHSDRYTRAQVVGPSTGSVHQTITVCELAPGGQVDTHVHAGEEAFFVLDGQIRLTGGGAEQTLRANDFVLVQTGVSHALANAASEPARWLEVGAPHSGADLGDPAFVDVGAAGLADDAIRRGRFDDSQLPPPSDTIGLEGFGAANVGGASLKMLVDREFGASQLNLFVVEYAPGGLIKEHDHPFEEAFFFLNGEIEAALDGDPYTLRAGEYCWSGVAGMHTFVNRADAPVRWLETQVPQPPARQQARFRGDWERLVRPG